MNKQISVWNRPQRTPVKEEWHLKYQHEGDVALANGTALNPNPVFWPVQLRMEIDNQNYLFIALDKQISTSNLTIFATKRETLLAPCR